MRERGLRSALGGRLWLVPEDGALGHQCWAEEAAGVLVKQTPEPGRGPATCTSAGAPVGSRGPVALTLGNGIMGLGAW